MKILKKCTTLKKETIAIHEEFMPYNTKSLDSKYRITLGNKLIKSISKRMPIETYRIFIGKNGDILLRPTVSIPSTEAWAYHNPKVITKIHEGLEESRTGKIERVNNLDSFLENL